MSAETLAAARAAANLTRGEWLLLLADGLVSASELIEFSASEEGTPLRRIPLWKVIAAELKVGRAAAKQRASLIQQSCGATGSRQPTVGWLIDRRAGGKRLIAFANALRAPGPPWPGFPLSPKPVHEGANK